MAFPFTRLSRLRSSEPVRRLVRETAVHPGNLVMPLFVRPGRNLRRPVKSMPGQFQLSVDQAVREAKEARRLGISGVILFGIPSRKDESGSEAYAEDGIVQVAIREIKARVPDLAVIADCCFCEYTSHGHCGVVRKGRSGWVLDNDATLELLAREAVAQADAGADVIAPSGMADGMVRAIRSALDGSGHSDRVLLSYAAKYASAFYGPFRDAAEGSPKFGDRKAYQMDVANGLEALREVGRDLEEGADLVMVKPALAYLDVIRRVREKFSVPVAAYNVSGEYSMIKAAAANGWMDEQAAVREVLTSIRRAGADFIITYHAKEIAKVLGR
jgi:porphobilinogen synthase